MRFLERPDTPAQTYAAVAGIFLAALGILSLIFAGVDFGTVGTVAAQPEFLIWSVSGWTAIFWIAMGGLGLLSMARPDSARTYALGAGAVFAVVAIWGFIDGNDVAELLVADTTNNITHAVLAALGLLTGLMPRATQRPGEDDMREPRFARQSSEREHAGRW
jgi:hypothetical protein